jgi:hypothetical protein
MSQHVYVIGWPDYPLVKIGLSGDVDERFRQIRTMSPVPLQVLWKTPGGQRLETALHRYFRSVREHGEWFRLPDPVNAVKEALQDPALHAPLPDHRVRTGWRQPSRISGDAVHVHEDLLARLDSGEFPAGSLLPRTAEIANQYGVSVIVAVKALKHLEVQGKVVWPHRGPVTVLRPEPGAKTAG